MIQFAKYLIITLSVVISTGALANSKPPSRDKTLFRNGLNAAGYTDLLITSRGVKRGDSGTPFLKIGWQFTRVEPFIITIGYGSVGVGGSSSYHGVVPEFLYEMTGDITLGLGSIFGKGYMERTEKQSYVGDTRSKIPVNVFEAWFSASYRLSQSIQLIGGISSRSYELNGVDDSPLAATQADIIANGDTSPPQSDAKNDGMSIMIGIRSSQF